MGKVPNTPKVKQTIKLKSPLKEVKVKVKIKAGSALTK